MTSRNGLPPSWEWIEFSEILGEVNKVQPKQNPEKEFIYLDISSIDNIQNKIISPKRYLGKDAPSRARQLVYSGDILFSTVRTYLKNIAQVPPDFDGQIASTGFCVIRLSSPLNKTFFFYLTLTDRFINPLSKIQRGTSYPAVRNSDVYEQYVPLPPLPEQKRIVNKIEELFTQLDAGVAELQKAKAQLKRYRQAVLKAAVEGELTREWREAHQDELETASELLERILMERRAKWEEEELAKIRAKGKEPKDDKWKSKYKEPVLPETNGLPELPEEWIWTHIEPLLETSREGMKTGPFGSLLKKHEHRDEGVPVIGIENIGVMKYVPGNKIHVTKEKAAQLTKYDVQTDDIIISRSGTVGEVAVIPNGLGESRLSTNVMRITLDPTGMRPLFFAYLFNGSPFVLSQVSVLCKGSTRDFLNQRILKSIVFPLPPLLEQNLIIRKVERRLSVVDEIESELNEALSRAEQLRQSILNLAFAGQLVQQNPNDEPTSVLLKRIKQKKKPNTKTSFETGENLKSNKMNRRNQRQLGMFDE